jgi:hypothetical protein
MAYVSLAGLIVLLCLGLVQWMGQVRRNVASSRPYRHGDDPEWECSTRRRLRLRP